MPIVISPNGQPVFALTNDLIEDYLRQGYRLPNPITPPPLRIAEVTAPPEKVSSPEAEDNSPVAPEPDTGPEPEPVLTANGGLNLLEATLAQLVALPDVGTARAKKVRRLAQESRLNLDSLQAEVPEVDWVAMYNQGLVVWPGGLHVVEAE